jgi:ribosomal protein S18 acetylase RimI-like enzyme
LIQTSLAGFLFLFYLTYSTKKQPVISYQKEVNLSPEEFRDILDRSTLGERRPVDDPDRLWTMLQHADLVFTARDEGKLVGVSRSLSDFTFCTYMSDLAVDTSYQRTGIGKELIRLTKLEVPNGKLILLAAPAAREYYPKIGMTGFEYCFVLDDVSNLK